jgi:uncharacterized membrane protein
MTRSDRRALSLAGLIGSAGVMHFVQPEFFDAVVPDWMPGSKRTTTYVSGVVELIGAALLVRPSTRRAGGWWCAATFVGVFPANIQAALDGGMKDMDPPFDSAAVAWLRLPLQFPLITWSVRVAREA